MHRATIGAATVAGLATGPRSFTALAAVVLATRRGASAQPDRLFGHPATKTIVTLLALVEWVMDKLPDTPSRLEVLGLATRVVGAGATGATLARRAQVADAPAEPGADQAPGSEVAGGAETVPTEWKAVGVCAGLSAGVALGVAMVGVQLRRGFDAALGRDWPGAALEDASAAALAATAVYVASRP